jgi:hypothetical protein
MATRTLQIELPDELIDLVGSPEAAVREVREAFILQLLRDARISQGQAAGLLGITRWDLLDLMAQHQIPSGPETPEEMRREIEEIRAFVSGDEQRGDRQQQ